MQKKYVKIVKLLQIFNLFLGIHCCFIDEENRIIVPGLLIHLGTVTKISTCTLNGNRCEMLINI